MKIFTEITITNSREVFEISKTKNILKWPEMARNGVKTMTRLNKVYYNPEIDNFD
jgi:hypothetical protein